MGLIRRPVLHELQRDKNTIRIESIPFQSWWTRWISIDWGFKHDAVCLLARYSASFDSPDGYQPERTVTYRETSLQEAAVASPYEHWLPEIFEPDVE